MYGVLSTCSFNQLVTTGTVRGAGFVVGDAREPSPLPRPSTFAPARLNRLLFRTVPGLPMREQDRRWAAAVEKR